MPRLFLSLISNSHFPVTRIGNITFGTIAMSGQLEVKFLFKDQIIIKIWSALTNKCIRFKKRSSSVLGTAKICILKIINHYGTLIMNIIHRILRHYKAISMVLLALMIATGCSENRENGFQGYIEGEYLLVSSPIGGQLHQLSVSRGDRVDKGDALFVLDRNFEQAAVNEAKQVLQRAEKRLADISKGLRPSELDAIKARLEQSKASYQLSKTEFDRQTKLVEQKVTSREQLDRTRTELERNRAAVSQLTAELETAQLGGRPDAIEAARADVEAARSKLDQAQWRYDQKKQQSPESGLVFDTFYVQGEYVPAAHPVVSILPPSNIMLRFFVPETALSSLKVGQDIYVQVDGKDQSLKAKITYISPQAEYTPPIIYSRETRSKLVFMIEANFAQAEAIRLHPGQPADVYLEKKDG